MNRYKIDATTEGFFLMQNVLKTGPRKLFRGAKKLIRHSAIKVLATVDDSFLHNVNVSVPSPSPRRKSVAVNLPTAPIAEPKNLAPADEGPIVLVNEGGVLSNIQTVKIVFSSIFQNELEKEVLQDIWSHVLDNRVQSATYEGLVALLRSYLNKKANGGDADTPPVYITALKKLSDHCKTTEESRLAYSPSTNKSIDTIMWPDPTYKKNPRSLFTELPYARSFPLIDKNTPVGSAGSCFAMEIAHRLQADNFNYVVTEPYQHNERGLSNSCARWGTIFNVSSFRQLIERHLEDRPLPRVLWSQVNNGKRLIYDPFREDIEFESEAEYEQSTQDHHVAARKALLESKVFVITLGMNEVWYLKADKSVCSRAPWKLASYLVEHKVLTVEENVQELQLMLDIWRKHNPDIQLIVSVSPVPLHATFRADQFHVITANCHSKSTLRVAAEEFVSRNRGVYYFPSYETVMYCTQNAWCDDQRHVSKEAVSNVMQLFKRMFVIQSEKTTTESFRELASPSFKDPQ